MSNSAFQGIDGQWFLKKWYNFEMEKVEKWT